MMLPIFQIRPGRTPVVVSGVALQTLAAVVWCSAAASVLAADNSAADPNSPERSMRFVEKSVEATELFNQRMLPEALQAFQELMREYGDLDEDGYVAVSLGDCLQAMGRYQEARTTYETVAVAHPKLAEPIRQRLWEMKLAGPIDDTFLVELRAAAATEGENTYGIKVQLGRALQKRAVAILSEAIDILRQAAEDKSAEMEPTHRVIEGQSEMLVELKEDLSSLIDRMERGWAGMKTIKEMIESRENPDRIQGCRSEWTSSFGDQQTAKLETQWQTDGTVKATINGRPVQLNSNQELIVRRHQERINAILLEATQAGSTEKPATR